MNVLHLKGAKYGIRVDALAPLVQTAMTDGLFSAEDAALLNLEAVTPALLFLVGEDAPSRIILGTGAGSVAVARIVESPALFLGEAGNTPEGIAAHWCRRARAISCSAFGPIAPRRWANGSGPRIADALAG